MNRTREKFKDILLNTINVSNRSIKDNDLTINIGRRKQRWEKESINMLNLKIHSAESIDSIESSNQ